MPAPTAHSTLSLHDALPISQRGRSDSTEKICFNVQIAEYSLMNDPVREQVVNVLRGGHAHVTLEDAVKDLDRKSTRLNSSHVEISYAVFCLKKKNTTTNQPQ